MKDQTLLKAMIEVVKMGGGGGGGGGGNPQMSFSEPAYIFLWHP